MSGGEGRGFHARWAHTLLLLLHRAIVEFLGRARQVRFQLDAKTRLEAEQLYAIKQGARGSAGSSGVGSSSARAVGGATRAATTDAMAHLERKADGADQGGVRLRAYLHWGSLAAPEQHEEADGGAP